MSEEAARDRALGDLRALAGVSKFPVRVKCATLAWNVSTGWGVLIPVFYTAFSDVIRDLANSGAFPEELLSFADVDEDERPSVTRVAPAQRMSLVGQMCNEILSDPHLPPAMRPLFERLRFPLIKIALADGTKGLVTTVFDLFCANYGLDRGFGGAALMAAEAACRTGAGLVSAATHPSHVSAFLTRRPEIMARGVEEDDEFLALLERAEAGGGASAESSQRGRTPKRRTSSAPVRSSRFAPANAIIAPLSVHSSGSG